MQIGEDGNISGYNYTLLGIVKMKFTYGIFFELPTNTIHIMLYTSQVTASLDFKEKAFKPINKAFETYNKSFEVSLEEILEQLLSGAIDKTIDEDYPKNEFENRIANLADIVINEKGDLFTLFGVFRTKNSKYSHKILFNKNADRCVIRTYDSENVMFNKQSTTADISNIESFDDVKDKLLCYIKNFLMGKINAR